MAMIFVCKDDVRVAVDGAAVRMSRMLSNMAEDFAPRGDSAAMTDDDTGPVLLPMAQFDADTATAVVEFCRRHPHDSTGSVSLNQQPTVPAEEVRYFEERRAQFMDMLHLANFLDMEYFVGVACYAYASMVAGKTPDEIRAMFNVVDDFDAEERAQVLRENAWAEEYG